MNHLDLSFDGHFAQRASLPWWPWVGSQYVSSRKRTLVLGESVYDWSDTPRERELFQARYAERDGLRDTHTNHAMDFRRDTPYVRNVERAVFSTSKPADAMKHAFWTSVAYHNLVLEPLASLDVRPSLRQFRAGWAEALDLCILLDVRQVLVYGVGSVPALKLEATSRGLDCRIRKLRPQLNRCYPRVGTLTLGGSDIQLLFIRHPSTFFSWEKWSAIIGAHLSLG